MSGCVIVVMMAFFPFAMMPHILRRRMPPFFQTPCRFRLNRILSGILRPSFRIFFQMKESATA
jgi:hypothetical protein